MSRAAGAVARKRQAPPAGSVFAGQDVCSLAALALNPGSTRPRYEEDIWVLTGMSDAHNLVSQSQKIWDFTRIANPRWRPVVKDILIALLVPRHPAVLQIPSASRVPRSPLTCHDYLWGLTGWLNWLTRRGVSSLSDVTQNECDAYLHEQSWTVPDHDGQRRRLHPASVSHMVRCVQSIANYAGLLRDERYRPGFYPWRARSANVVSGHRPVRGGGNQTQPVNDDVLRPLLAACLYLVDVLGSHLADLHDQIRADADRNSRLPSMDIHGAAGKMREHLRRLVEDQEPLPQLRDVQVGQRLKDGWAPTDPLLHVNLDRMMREAGICQNRASLNLAEVRAPLTDAVALVGVAPPLARRAAHIPTADTGQPIAWTEPLYEYDLLSLTQHVVSACLVLCAAISGMRRSELAGLVGGCRLPAIDIPGGGRRHRLASRLIKGQPFGGVADEWVVLPEVDRAVHLAERVTNAKPGQPLFGRSLDVGQRYITLRDWLGRPFAARLGLSQPPEGPLTAAMLRRTLALELARRPGGLLAARIHLRHVSVVTTEGYSHQPGGAQALFHAETQQLQAEHHLELTVQAFRDYQNGAMPSGPGARELVNAFKHVDGELRSTDANVLDDGRVADLLRRQAGTLHLAPANYCWFRDPAKALCLKLAGTPSASSPLAAMCDSARCPQATHHAQHRPAWTQAVETHKVFLGTIRRGQAGERQRLRAELDRAQRVVDEIDATSPSSQKAVE